MLLYCIYEKRYSVLNKSICIYFLLLFKIILKTFVKKKFNQNHSK